MKIASFSRDGRIDCGIVQTDDTFKVFDGHPVLGSIEPEKRLFHLLRLDPDERRRIDSEMGDALVVRRSEVGMLPAVPLCPLYIYGHANNPTVWKRQISRDWETTRVPYMRIRSFSCFSGDGWPLYVPRNATVSVGAELGVVVGREAYRVSLDKAKNHISGLLALNDNFLQGAHDEFVDTSSEASVMHQNQGLHVLYKTADGNGGMGPWIAAAEELEDVMSRRFCPQAIERYVQKNAVPWIYDKIMRTRVGGELFDESYTNAYLLGAEWLIAYFSRFMRLPTGTILGLGAAGWDGVQPPPVPEGDEPIQVSVELQDVGTLRTEVKRMPSFEKGESPFIRSRKNLGLSPVPPLSERPGRSLWVLRGNNPESEPDAPVTKMNPILYPSTSLREDRSPIVLPPHASSIRLAVHIAGIVGQKALYNTGVSRLGPADDSDTDGLDGICLLLSVRDMSLLEAVNDPTPYEARAAYLLGSSGEGFFRMGAPVTPSSIGGLMNATLSASLPSVGKINVQTSGYRFGFSDMLAMVTRTITLLPGDILSLGSAGTELEVPADCKLDGEVLEIGSSWGAKMSFTFQDERDTGARESQR